MTINNFIFYIYMTKRFPQIVQNKIAEIMTTRYLHFDKVSLQ